LSFWVDPKNIFRSFMSFFGSVFEYASRGGYMMIPLLISGCLAGGAILERLFLFHHSFRISQNFLQKAYAFMESAEIQQAQKHCASATHTPAGSVLHCALNYWNRPLDQMQLAIQNEAESWVFTLEKRMDLIDTVITAAPLMGLLGTITGMMASFQGLSEKGMHEPQAITGGVAEALIATATGLIIALVCLAGYNHLNAQIKEFIASLERLGGRLLVTRMEQERKKNLT